MRQLAALVALLAFSAPAIAAETFGPYRFRERSEDGPRLTMTLLVDRDAVAYLVCDQAEPPRCRAGAPDETSRSAAHLLFSSAAESRVYLLEFGSRALTITADPLEYTLAPGERPWGQTPVVPPAE